MNYVDANILIYALTDSSLKGEYSRKLLLNQELVTSTLSLDEVAYYLLKEKMKNRIEILEKLSKAPNLLWAAFTYECLPSFFSFLDKGLGPRDAIHASTAIKCSSAAIYSEDRDFDKVGLPRKIPWKNE